MCSRLCCCCKRKRSYREDGSYVGGHGNGYRYDVDDEIEEGVTTVSDDEDLVLPPPGVRNGQCHPAGYYSLPTSYHTTIHDPSLHDSSLYL